MIWWWCWGCCCNTKPVRLISWWQVDLLMNRSIRYLWSDDDDVEAAAATPNQSGWSIDDRLIFWWSNQLDICDLTMMMLRLLLQHQTSRVDLFLTGWSSDDVRFCKSFLGWSWLGDKIGDTNKAQNVLPAQLGELFLANSGLFEGTWMVLLFCLTEQNALKSFLTSLFLSLDPFAF